MKYSTKLIYGVPPYILIEMPHKQALEVCMAGAKLQILRFSKPPLKTWCGRRKALVAYIIKALEWTEEKLKEME